MYFAVNIRAAGSDLESEPVKWIIEANRQHDTSRTRSRINNNLFLYLYLDEH